MKRYAIWILALVLCSIGSSAQQLPNSLDPGVRKEVHSPKMRKSKTVKRKRQKVQHTAEYQFYERVEQAAKEKQRILKYLNKRQFKDHRYFGHKRIPKKRPPHKMRYCNECGVRH